MSEPQLSRGAVDFLKLLQWYVKRRVSFPDQEKLAELRNVEERQLRRYLAELKKRHTDRCPNHCDGSKEAGHVGLVEVQQRGDGQPASYTLNVRADVRADVRAEIEVANSQHTPNAVVAEENVRAEPPYLRSLSSKETTNTQSRSTVVESAQPPAAETEPEKSFPEVERQTLEKHIRSCGFEPTADLLGKLQRKAKFWRVSLFVVSAHIERAWRIVANTSNRPQKETWFLAVVENALAGTSEAPPRMPAPSTPTVAAIHSQITALASMKGFGAASRHG